MNNKKDIALLVARLIVGGLFIATGWMKIADMAATVTAFGQMGFAPFLAYLVTYVELLGGIMVVLGFYACFASIPLAIIMIVAAYVTRGLGIAVFATPLAMLASLVVFATSCGGRYSVKKCCSKSGRARSLNQRGQTT